jgi:RNA polymerase sigma-70 factor, ECF subfamily
VLETLTPAERTAFVLHDVFGLPFGEVAEIVGRTPAAVRQLAARARKHVPDGAPRFDADPQRHRQAVDAFSAALDRAGRVARFLTGIQRKQAFRPWPARINGGPGVVLTRDGTPVAAVSLTVVDGHVARVDMVLNPEKLAHTGALWKENP